MAYLIGKTRIDIINNDAIDISESLPHAVYNLVNNPQTGFYLEKSGINLEHGKIYGNADKISTHIIDAFEKIDTNMGVLLSGGKGLGKSMTAKLVVQKSLSKYPIIVIDTYYNGMFSFIGQISNAIFIFDEFEKVFAGDSSSDESGITKQEEMLSFLDGVTNGKHNLCILTANYPDQIDKCFYNRPGRIRYHYRFTTVNEQIIHEYCHDNLIDKSLENDITSALMDIQFISIDMIKAVVDEVNLFKCSVNEAMECLNIAYEADNLSAEVIIEYSNGMTANIFCKVYGNAHCNDMFSGSFGITDPSTDKYIDCDLYVKMKSLKIPHDGNKVDVTQYARAQFNNGNKVKINKVYIFDNMNLIY